MNLPREGVLHSKGKRNHGAHLIWECCWFWHLDILHFDSLKHTPWWVMSEKSYSVWSPWSAGGGKPFWLGGTPRYDLNHKTVPTSFRVQGGVKSHPHTSCTPGSTGPAPFHRGGGGVSGVKLHSVCVLTSGVQGQTWHHKALPMSFLRPLSDRGVTTCLCRAL